MARDVIKRRKSQREWTLKNPEKTKASRRRYHHKLRKAAIDYYGGKCACCGENEIKFLAIDHTNDDGNIHRKSIGSRGGTTTYRWLKKNGYPSGYQVLCHNCNMAKSFYGICPHQETNVPDDAQKAKFSTG